MSTFDGTPGNDSFTGTGSADSMTGAGGSDTLSGFEGNDTLEGGSDNDYLYGGIGHDSMLGGVGDDVIISADGDDTILGGDGSDHIQDGAGTNVIDSGDGDDFISLQDFAVTNSSTVTGGSGHDTYFLSGYTQTGTYVITDFAAGDDGDVFDMTGTLNESSGYSGGDPFAQDYLRLEPGGGGSTLLQWDRDGAGAGYTWRTMVTLQGVLPGSFTGANFANDIFGGAAETLDGSEDPDELSGGAFDDQVSGNGGGDTLSGGAGDDTLDGGADNDYLYGGIGDDSMDGGAGDDVVISADGNDTILGGDGDDHIQDGAGTNVIDAGDGDDVIGFEDFAVTNAATVTGGLGQDTYNLSGYTQTGTYVITDFAAGDGGDLFDMTGTLNQSSGYSGGDPFAQDYLRLEPGGGGSTLLQWDRDGAGAGYTWRTMVTLQGVLPGSFTGENFANGILGGAGETIDGTEGADELSGGAFDDQISGNGGGDILSGGAGDDTLDGGADNDYLYGGIGDDAIDGGTGDDVVISADGDDTILGGDGDDHIQDGAGTNVIDAGDGDDFISFQDFAVPNSETVTGGLGHDTYFLSGYTQTGTYVITDFAGGAGGDFLDLSGMLAQTSGYSGGNPFTQGYLRLLQSGSDTLLQWNRDGAAPGYDWRTMVTLQNVNAASVTSANFGRLLIGTEDDDVLIGGFAGDTLIGLGGNDTLDGGLGVDSMEGDAGDDTYFVNAAGDTAIENFGEGTDQVRSTASFKLGDEVENLKLLGGKAINGTGNELGNDIDGNLAANVLTGGDGNDTLEALDGNDTVLGGDGDDVILGGSGAGDDRYTGGRGNDTLRYPSANNPVVVDLGNGTGSGDNIGNDTIAGVENVTGGKGSDSITGDAVANNLFGAAGDDTLTGMAGNDTLQGGAGLDSLTGGLGNDTYIVEEPGDVLSEAGGGGSDKVVSPYSYTLAAGFEHLTLSGNATITGTGNGVVNQINGNGAENTLSGLGANDVLRGEGGNDQLSGGDGADKLYGGAGNDQLNGGKGADQFFFVEAPGAANADTIAGFVSGSDRIMLDDVVFTQLRTLGPLGLDDFGTYVVYTAGQLFYDADGAGPGGGLLIATLTGAPALQLSDIVVI